MSQNGYGCCGCVVLQFERSHLADARLCLFWIEPVLTRRPPTMSTPKIQYLLALLLEGFIDRAKLGRNRMPKGALQTSRDTAMVKPCEAARLSQTCSPDSNLGSVISHGRWSLLLHAGVEAEINLSHNNYSCIYSIKGST